MAAHYRELAHRALGTLRRRLPAPAAPAPAAPTPALDTTSTSAMLRWLRSQGTLPARPQYTWGCLHAARLGRTLGHSAVTVLEMGVAGGNGLLQLERAAARAGELLDVRVDIVGFDVGSGMPASDDTRDIPWAVQPGILEMDEPALRARLTGAALVVGLVSDTIPAWLAEDHAPIGFVAFDLDLYTATMDAFAVFRGRAEALLPRVACYFDDVFGYGWTDFTGERAAIHDFNTEGQRKIAKYQGLAYELPQEDAQQPWAEQIWMAHVFDAADYSTIEWRLPEAWAAAHRLDGGTGS